MYLWLEIIYEKSKIIFEIYILLYHENFILRNTEEDEYVVDSSTPPSQVTSQLPLLHPHLITAFHLYILCILHLCLKFYILL